MGQNTWQDEHKVTAALISVVVVRQSLFACRRKDTDPLVNFKISERSQIFPNPESSREDRGYKILRFICSVF